MILKLLKENNFDFSKIPADINSAVELLRIQTRGTFESDNEKLNMLDRTIFESIKNILPDDLSVIEAANVVSARESQDVNDSFNTVMPESYERISKSKSLPDENFNEPDSFNGKEAAGALIVAKNTGRVLLLLRNEDSGEPSTWAGAGGKVEEGESIEQALQRELQEEIGVSGIEVYPSYIFERENFTFHNFIGVVDEEFVPELNEEHSRYKWANVDNLPTPLHFGFREFLNNIDIKSEIQEIKSGITVFGKGGMIAPNGKKSNLTPEQYKLVRTPAFKKWFGDWENDPANSSKVVDENGEPLVAYHGSKEKFSTFKPAQGSMGTGIYFTPKLIVAQGRGKEDFSEGTIIYACFLNLRIPNQLRKDNDGIIYTFDKEKLKSGQYAEIMVLDSSQIKLADGTNTTFDPNNPDIRYGAGGNISHKEKLEMLYGAGGKVKILSKKDTAKYLKSQFKDYQKVNMPAGEIRRLARIVGKKAQSDWLKSPEFKAAYKRYEKDFEGERERNPDEKIDWDGLNHLMVADSREGARLEKLNKYRTGGEDALPIFVRAGLPPKERGKYVASTGRRSIMGVPTGQEWRESGVSVFDAEYFGKEDFIVVNTGESDSLTIAFNESSASGRPLYLVEGDWIGDGADGEPTLDPRTIKVIGELSGKNVFNDYASYAGFTYDDERVEHPHKEWILSKSRFEAGGKIPESLFSEYGNLIKVNKHIQSAHPKLYVVQGAGYLYWHSDDDDLALKLAGLYSASIPIAKASHQSIGTWLKEADEIMEQVNNSDKKYGAGGFMPAGFSELTFIHASDKKNRKSILENGLGASNNPVIVNGIYTFPKDWGHWGQETFGDKDWYYIKLKKDAKIYWTDADRPIDMEFGRGSSEFKRVYKDLIAKTGKTKKEIAYLQGEEWFEWKTQFSRLMEEYLRDNGYDAIQKGGEVVIVNLDAIQSVLLDNKTPIKLSSQKYYHRHESGGALLQPEENNLTTVIIRAASTDEPIMIEVSDYLPSSDVKNVVSGKYADWIEFQYKNERFERAMPESRAQNELRRRVTGVRPVAVKCHVELLKNGKRFSKIGHSSHYLAHREGEKWKALGMGNDYVVI